jgi:fatty acid desaturase
MVPKEAHDGMKPRYYARHSRRVKEALKAELTTEEIRRFHRLEPRRHFAILARHVALTLGSVWVLWRFDNPLVWIPVAILQGFNILGFIILLHEQVHDTIFRGRHPRLNRLLGLLYAFPSAISASQFARWHLDHHNELGSPTTDPKRAHLTPKIVARWYKLLYMTPALFVIYSIASAREAATYPESLRRRIAWEKRVNILLHLGGAATLVVLAGWGVMARVWLVPLFFTFPFAFTLNRLGQHYDIVPDDPLKWSTLVNSHPFWDFLFLYSNMHLEHHYFPRVPFYNLPALNRRLQGFYARHGMRPRTYAQILKGWFLDNKVPHTDWEGAATPPPAPQGQVGAA